MPLKKKVKQVELTPKQAAALAKKLSVLRRKYRIVQGDTFIYSGRSNPVLAKYRKLLTILEDELRDVKNDLKVATASAKLKQDEKDVADLKKAIFEFESITDDVNKAKAIKADLHKQIVKAQEKIHIIRPRALTDEQYHEKRIAKQRSLAVQENRLEAVVKNYDREVARAVEMQAKIVHKVKHRDYFMTLWNKFLTHLEYGHDVLEYLENDTNATYNERDRLCKTVAAWEKVGRQNLIDYTRDIKEYRQHVEDEYQRFRFYQIKGKHKVMESVLARQEKKKKKTVQHWENAYEDAQKHLRDIQEFCGETDVNKIATEILRKEHHNFGLYNLITEIHEESNDLVYTLKDLKRRIDSQRLLKRYREYEHEAKITMMASKLTRQILGYELKKAKYNKIDGKVSKVLDGLTSVVQILKFKAEPILQLLGNNASVNIYNYKIFIGLIELNTADILRKAFYNEKKDKDKRKKPGKSVFLPDSKLRYTRKTIDELVPNTPCPLCMEKGQISERTGVLQIPRDIDEIKEKLAIRRAQPHFDRKIHSISACLLPQARIVREIDSD